MLRRRVLMIASVLAACGGLLSGCASDSDSARDPTAEPSEAGRDPAREAERKQMCDDIAQQLRAVGTSRSDGLFPFPEYRNREFDPSSPDAEIYELRNLQRRYRCGR